MVGPGQAAGPNEPRQAHRLRVRHSVMGWIEAYTAPKQDILRRVYLSVGTLVAALLLAIWWLLSYGGIVRAELLPTVVALVPAGTGGIKDGSLAVDTVAMLS